MGRGLYRDSGNRPSRGKTLFTAKTQRTQRKQYVKTIRNAQMCTIPDMLGDVFTAAQVELTHEAHYRCSQQLCFYFASFALK
jgi:hypothetical protein